MAASSPQSLTEEQQSRFSLQFLLFDTDGDGKISISQLGPLLRSLGMSPSPSQVKSLERVVDADGFGFISREKFLSVAGGQQQWNLTDAELQDALNVLDANGNGCVSVAELRYALAHHGEGISEADIDEVLQDLVAPGVDQIYIDDAIKLLLHSYLPEVSS